RRRLGPVRGRWCPARGRRAVRHRVRMQPSHTAPALTRADVARKAWPIILANASVPLLGLVDTAVIGHYGSTSDLGALALGALLFNFIYWSFGFLRMSTTG